MQRQFEYRHHCAANEAAQSSCVTCVLTRHRGGRWTIDWRLTPEGDRAATGRTSTNSVESHACYYCGVDFDRLRPTLYAIVPLAASYFRSGGEHARWGMHLAREAIRRRIQVDTPTGQATLPDEDLREILETMSPYFRARKLQETEEQTRQRIRREFDKMKLRDLRAGRSESDLQIRKSSAARVSEAASTTTKRRKRPPTAEKKGSCV